MASESRKTVVVALGANLGIAVAKAAGGAVSGSSAMLAEAAHSLADTTNQLFLLASLRLSSRKANAKHPFGYGKERFFWSFMAAIFIFVSGALFSIFEGVQKILSGSSDGSVGIAFAVLAVAFVLEGISLIRAGRQARDQARAAKRPLSRHIRLSRDPTVKTVASEDSAALVGLVLAAAGLALSELTGAPLWDGVASIMIGLLLAGVAVALGRDTKDLLIGEAALPEELERMESVIRRHEGVDELVELLTMALGPEALLVAARFDVADGLDSRAVERLADELDVQLRDAVPEVTQVFLDPTGRGRVSATSSAAPAPHGR